MAVDIVETFKNLRDSYFRYYDTPFGLADRTLEAERRQLLDQDNGVYREPFIELRPEYRTTGRSVQESASLAHAPTELGDFVAKGLIPLGRQLYTHQEAALISASGKKRNVVVTAGTGAGKTEAFLLPLLANLLAESQSWAGNGAAPVEWWRQANGPFIPQRQTETGRTQAVRAIILYPMNALVDDQLVRLRRAIDSTAARQWLDENRRGHRFYFGRYTGATPVTGAPGNRTALQNLRSFMQGTHQRSQALGLDDESRYFVPHPGGAEMLSRWDMADAVPDILITNYSMLNVLLLRDRDRQYFDSTRDWLRANPEHRFTLVVDELHTYRGTAGTEVALLIRNLKMRLGLDDRSDQLQVIAASASLEADRDEAYVEQFFAVPRETFDFLPGQIVRPEVSESDLSGTSFASGSGTPTKEDEAAAATALGNAFFFGADGTADTKPLAKSVKELSTHLFPELPDEARIEAVHRVLKTAAESEAGETRWPMLRSHLFFRNVPGMWACTDAGCPEADQEASPTRPIGRLYAEPVSRCLCGSRVLELLYCQNCGDVFLGGYVPTGSTQKPGQPSTLLADLSDLEHLPDQANLERTADNYLLYWPQKRRPDLDALEWNKDNGKVTYAFRRSHLQPLTGELRPTDNDDFTGWTFHVLTPQPGARSGAGASRRDPQELSPFPTRCPNCSDDWEITHTKDGPVAAADKKRQRSPIRAMRTGFEKINQVLITELLQSLGPSNRKTIVFADSRQDAAKLSSGISLRHYQDLLRLLLHQELSTLGQVNADVELAREHFVNGHRTDESREAIARLRLRDLPAFTILRDVWEGESDVPEDAASRALTRRPSLPSLAAMVAHRLLDLGMNPGGPRATLQRTTEKMPGPWSHLYRWEPTVEAKTGLSTGQQDLLNRINESLEEEVIDGLFSGAGRDYESLGLGWLGLIDTEAESGKSPSSPAAIARGSLRVLADMRRFAGLRNTSLTPPRRLKNYWAAVAKKYDLDVDELQSSVLGAWGPAVLEFLIQPGAVTIHEPTTSAWVCGNCRRQHLVYGCGLCTYCRRELPKDATAPSANPDYYGYNAIHAKGQFRLNTAELSGQTDRLDAQSRQARFQDVFLNQSENKKTDGIELLSVTTTMEAGVDIGALDSVVLANMPPTRFNYQQRVGRAGRRSTPMAVSLTVCRGRSHDEYYFGRPELITNAPTPKPYLALSRPEIYLRSVRSEVLRRAFNDLADVISVDDSISGLGNNTHGQFGQIADWSSVKPLILAWMEDNADSVKEVVEGLANFCTLPGGIIQTAADSLYPLFDRISDIAEGGVPGHSDLSQRLAEEGILPMFGFPSKVRNLFLQKPNSPFPWPPDNVIDRDSAMAVSQFAPGSELVRDGRIYPVIGVTSYRPSGPSVATEEQPLGEQRLIDICRHCAFVENRPTGSEPTDTNCPRCGADSGSFGTIDLREPLGYRAGKARDFDGNFSWTPRSTSTRAMTDLETLSVSRVESMAAYSGPAYKYVINDNSGKSFNFMKASDYWGGYLAAAPDGSPLDGSPLDSAGRLRIDPSATPIISALGTIQPTDFLFLGPRNPIIDTEGLRLNLTSGLSQQYGPTDSIQGRRAAWYSLGFLMRTVAASYLDVQPQEFTAGIFTGLQENEPTTFAFLADSLENGAGFSSHLGQPDVLPGFLSEIDSYLTELAGDHAIECTSSCYRCLRDYSNMAYHALLDWRLAKDLLDVLHGKQLIVDTAQHQGAIRRWAAAYSMTSVDNDSGACAIWDKKADGRFGIILRHPLESAEQGLMPKRLVEATTQMELEYPDLDGIVYVDSFVLDRDPSHVVGLLREVH
ncbi:DEAD/DEAH box helicase [Arthrobacter sp. MI7-26]|uniref:DEAD/DEAH box helicase n=1 Tax=Arthrobacter sp. MI7-26 TaxID=2993653 RepID=UPI0022491BC0|nr:DEAD/DEAH box helicase [Arthrobacter sp. MI7-26]MCX2746283.1 DEAD/DEAH box helicase [Arthrobacter sp. MI7-26]